jgi:hypothetical protein
MGFRVLVTGAASPAGCAMLEALRDDSAELLACDSAAGGAISAEIPAQRRFHVHKNDDPEFVGDLVTLCVRHQVDVLVPMCGGDQLALARVLQVFERLGTRVWLAPNPACATHADARRILQLAERSGTTPSVSDWFRRISRLGAEPRDGARLVG